MRQTSKEAFSFAKHSGKIKTTKIKIIEALKGSGGATRQMLSKETNKQINCITQPVKELLKAGVLIELPPKKCKITSYKAHYLLFNDFPKIHASGTKIDPFGQGEFF